MEWSLLRIRAKIGHGHVAGNALISRAVGFVVGMGSRVLYPLLVAGQAGLVGLFLLFEPVTSTGGMALDTVELSGLDAGTHHPERVGVVFTQVPAVGVEIRVFQRGQVEVVEEPVARLESRGQRNHLGVTRPAVGVMLLGREKLRPDELEILGRGPFGRLPEDAVMLLARTVTGFAVDPGLGPDWYGRCRSLRS